MSHTSISTLLILIATILLGGLVLGQDSPRFTREPINEEDLANLLGIEKSGFHVKLPERKVVRLVAEITVKGKTRKEFIALKSMAQEFSVAVFTIQKPNTSRFQQLSVEISSEGGEKSRHSFDDFDGTVLNGKRTSLDKGTVSFDYHFQTNSKGPADKKEDLGSVKIYLETSSTPFPEKT